MNTSIKKLGASLVLGALGLLSGSALQSATAPQPAEAYCEYDICTYQTFCDASFEQKGCDRLFDGSCWTYNCSS